MSSERERCLARLRDQVKAGRPIVGGGAGTGLSAKCAEAGGIESTSCTRGSTSKQFRPTGTSW